MLHIAINQLITTCYVNCCRLSVHSQHVWIDKEITVVNKILKTARNVEHMREDNPNLNALHALSKTGRYA